MFIDTNLTWLPDEWWEELLSVPGRVHLTGRVTKELIPFLQRNPAHPLRAAISAKHHAIVLHPDPDDDPGLKSFKYYVSLLSYRRYLLSSAVEHFKLQHAREPTSSEMTDLKMKLQNFAGERTLRLNTKVASPEHTDEVLAFLAVHHAVTTGQPTKIFSGDSDVEEQFYMMVRLLTAHYYGLLLGRRYASNFTNFKPRPLAADLVSKYESAYEPRNAVMIDLGSRGIHDFIPKHTTFVPVTCATIGREYSSEVTYGAETTMAEVFATKARTFGLSTDRLSGRNIHPWMIPKDFRIPGSNDALIAFDKTATLPDSGMRIALTDIMLTTWPGDPHVRIAPPTGDGRIRGVSIFVPPSGRRGVMPMFARRPAPILPRPRR
ncbi:MAG TPA: hypothetical protein VHY18_03385 [Solirubrobacteraceae bacterium]|nr:hypothetical protein [Solirubrobacteraceae bacterium]